MSHTYGHIYVHIVFSTKYRRALLTRELHAEFASYIHPILRVHGAKLIAEGGMPDHVHALVDLGRKSSAGTVMREMKAYSSKWLKSRTDKDFSWQTGYGVFSVSASHLQNVIGYIHNQERHHQGVSFEQEFEEILIAAGCEFDPKTLWVEIEEAEDEDE